MNRSKKKSLCNYSWILLFAVIAAVPGFTSPVSPGEATNIADLLYIMELNSGYLKITETERTNRLVQMGNHQVMYMISMDELIDEFPAEQPVLAYVVTYAPNGFVVVSGDDRIEPIMVYSAESEFRWDDPEMNFLRYYLGRVMPGYWKHMPSQTHQNWILLRNKLAENRDNVTYDNIGRAIYIYWSTENWDQDGYYSDTCRAYNGGANVPTGCVATATAIKMKFHNWPRTGTGSHAYSDTAGTVTFDHAVDYSSMTYNWDPCGQADIARIMYHAGVSVDMNYEIDASGAVTLKVADALNNYFRYRGTVKDSSSISVMIPGLVTCITGKLPVVCGGEGHAILIDGYRDDLGDRFHMNLGWSGSGNGWFLLDSLPWDTTGTGVIKSACPYGQPNSWIYVDKFHGGTEDGRILYPYNTLTEGEGGLSPGGELLIKTGTYTGSGNVPITFNIRTAVRAYAGDVVIGENVWIRNYDAIKLHDGGELKVTP